MSLDATPNKQPQARPAILQFQITIFGKMSRKQMNAFEELRKPSTEQIAIHPWHSWTPGHGAPLKRGQKKANIQRRRYV